MANQMNLDTLWQEARNALEQRLAEVKEEIRYYPPPIPACDVHFNALLEERAKIPHELRRLAELQQQPAKNTTSLEQFIASSAYLDEATRIAITTAIGKTADLAL
ncbi:MAG: hypothetical protein AAF614_28240 [Chloroflexota bacterium]